VKPILRAICAAVVLAGGGALAVAQAPPPSAAPPEQMRGAARISVEECRQALANKTAIVVDVRGEEAFRAGHIAGAVSLPNGADPSVRAEEFKKAGKTIITYCA